LFLKLVFRSHKLKAFAESEQYCIIVISDLEDNGKVKPPPEQSRMIWVTTTASEEQSRWRLKKEYSNICQALLNLIFLNEYEEI
jgi:hypothetical protein